MVKLSLLNAVDTMTIVFIVLLVVLIVALLVVPMFTNKKRAKQTEELHRSLHPGDVVKTVGGIIGTIKEIRQVSPIDNEMVIETGVGDNKTTMVFDIQALYQVMSRAAVVDDVQPEKHEEVPAPAEVKEETPVAPVAEEPVAEEKVEEKAEVKEEPVQEQAAVAEEKVSEEKAEEPVKEEKPATHAPAKKKPVNSGAKKSGSAKK